MVHVLGPCHTWDSPKGLLAPGFGLAKPWLCGRLGSEPPDEKSVFFSAFQINKLIKNRSKSDGLLKNAWLSFPLAREAWAGEAACGLAGREQRGILSLGLLGALLTCWAL